MAALDNKEARRYGRDFDELRARVGYVYDRLTPYEAVVLDNSILSVMRAAFDAGYFEASLDKEYRR